MQNLRYEEMCPKELAEARDKASLVYVPIGSIEYHGLHLFTGLDTINAYQLTLRAAERTGGVVLPPTFWGTEGHEKFPGSLLLKKETIAALMRDVLDCLTKQEYRLIVICTGHYPAVQGQLLEGVAAEHMKRHTEMQIIVLDPFTLCPFLANSEHAGIFETSIGLYLKDDMMHMERLKEPGALKAIAGNCVDATAELGRKYFETTVDEMVSNVKDALGHRRTKK